MGTEELQEGDESFSEIFNRLQKTLLDQFSEGETLSNKITENLKKVIINE